MYLLKNLIRVQKLKKEYRKNRVSAPEVVNIKEKPCIGFYITTSLKDDRKSIEILSFFHEIYDSNKLSNLWKNDNRNMYCVFKMHLNGQDFNYYIVTDNNQNLNHTEYVEITIPKGKYVKVDLLKRNQSAVMKIMMFLRIVWIKKNGYKPGSSPTFIQYDERFHSNYKQHGCIDGNYPGNPIASLYIPIEN